MATSTRAARLKWVVVVNADLPPGRAVNAAVCVAAATVEAVGGLLGPPATDGSGSNHPGLPWAGCSVLLADAGTLRTVREKGVAHDGTYVADMPAPAQETRVYGEYLDAMRTVPREEMEYLAVSLVGPRNRIDRIVGRLPLMP